MKVDTYLVFHSMFGIHIFLSAQNSYTRKNVSSYLTFTILQEIPSKRSLNSWWVNIRGTSDSLRELEMCFRIFKSWTND